MGQHDLQFREVLQYRDETVRLGVSVPALGGAGVGQHGKTHLAAGLVDRAHPRVVRFELLNHRVELDALGAQVGHLPQVLDVLLR